MDESTQQQQQLRPGGVVKHVRGPHFLSRVYDSMSDALAGLSAVLEVRDAYTYGHCFRVAVLAQRIAKGMGLCELACHEIYLAGLVHDIGKVGLPDAILHKPGSLSEQEYQQVRLHPEIGYRIVERIPHLQFALPGILHHHEQWNGSGYPHGLQGRMIPIMARVLAVADSFDAMTSKRAYREPLTMEAAVGRLVEGRGVQWEHGVVDQLLHCLERWPRLGTERVSDSVLQPSVANLCQSVAALSY
jgi:HD-GYP domain-containing protein (c-di-GMP phosphodiesterase class II)